MKTPTHLLALLSSYSYSYGPFFAESVLSKIEADRTWSFAFRWITLPGLAAASAVLLLMILGDGFGVNDVLQDSDYISSITYLNID